MRNALVILLMVMVLFLAPGCGKIDKAFHRPNLVCVTPDQSRLVFYDYQDQHVVIADRQFRHLGTIAVPEGSSVWGLDVTPANEIVVANTRQAEVSFTEEERKTNAIAEILFYDFSGNLKHHLEWTGETGPIDTPGPVRVLPDGSLLVADFQNNRILHFDRAGKVLDSFGEFGNADGQLHYPNDLAIDGQGNCVVVNSYNSRIEVFGPDRKFLRTVGAKGRQEGQLLFPQNLCIDAQGNILVSELATMRISVFDREFRFLRTIDPHQQGVKEEFIELFGLATASDTGELYVADSKNSRIYVFDREGKLTRSVDTLD